MNDIPGYIRTYVPIGVAWLAGWLASLGIEVSDGAQAALSTGIGAVVAALYYAAVRFAEKRWPWVGKFLGSATPPTYTTADMHTAAVDTKPIGGDHGAA